MRRGFRVWGFANYSYPCPSHFEAQRGTSIYEGGQFILFCFVVMRSTELGCFRLCSWCLWCLWKLSTRRGAWAWFHDIWTCGVKVLEYWMISSLKIKLNRRWKFRRNWNVPSVLLVRSWWVGFNGIYLVRFGFIMWEILIFKWFLPLKIQINFKKPGFGRKNQLRTW
jgi:hypothetical protein